MWKPYYREKTTEQQMYNENKKHITRLYNSENTPLGFWLVPLNYSSQSLVYSHISATSLLHKFKALTIPIYKENKYC